MRPSWVEVDLDAVAHNVAAFCDLIGDRLLCAVVKADAYGHGDVPVAEVAVEAGAEWLAVALVEEGIRLREAGIEAPILLLSEPASSDAALVAEWNITPTVYRHSFLEQLADLPSPPSVHIKYDSGMHRVGADAETVIALAHQATALGIDVQGTWTHLAVAEDDPSFTAEQLGRMDLVVERMRGEGLEPGIVHVANTAGTILFERARADMVRVGLGIYGLYPSPECRSRIDLRPAMRVVSRVSHVRRHPQGSRPSYGRRRELASDSTVATVPVGYADGYPRLLSDAGEVLVAGRRHPLAGTVTMDQIVVDCGDRRVAVGDEVVLLGGQMSEEIPADEWAEKAHTISYEVVCGIGPRLPRRYLRASRS